MRNFAVSLALVVGALALGCSRSEENKGPAAAAEPSAPAAAPVAAAPPSTTIDYDCGGGASFSAKIEKGNALVTVDGKTATLTPSSGVGAMFAGEGLTYIPNGPEATLIKDGQAPQTCKARS